jgi:putative CocE/NonD family hydrolase
MDIEIPVARYFVMGRNRWQTANAWPPPQTQWQRFFLHSRGNANTSAGDGVLSRDEPRSENPDIFVYDPHRPVPSVGGRVYGNGVVPGPIDQSRVEMRNDVLCYTTRELDDAVEVTGALQVHLFAATSARDTDFTAKLVDVYPDGCAYNIVEGIVRASGRTLNGARELVTPGDVIEYVIQMGDTSQLFRKGHRIRIEISSSNFPTFDRNMNTGNPIGQDARGIVAMQTIYHQTDYASYIDLPVMPNGN